MKVTEGGQNRLKVGEEEWNRWKWEKEDKIDSKWEKEEDPSTNPTSQTYKYIEDIENNIWVIMDVRHHPLTFSPILASFNPPNFQIFPISLFYIFYYFTLIRTTFIMM
jgi:hypothetical protein